jgi:hypothetical protein
VGQCFHVRDKLVRPSVGDHLSSIVLLIGMIFLFFLRLLLLLFLPHLRLLHLLLLLYLLVIVVLHHQSNMNLFPGSGLEFEPMFW